MDGLLNSAGIKEPKFIVSEALLDHAIRTGQGGLDGSISEMIASCAARGTPISFNTVSAFLDSNKYTYLKPGYQKKNEELNSELGRVIKQANLSSDSLDDILKYLNKEMQPNPNAMEEKSSGMGLRNKKNNMGLFFSAIIDSLPDKEKIPILILNDERVKNLFVDNRDELSKLIRQVVSYKLPDIQVDMIAPKKSGISLFKPSTPDQLNLAIQGHIKEMLDKIESWFASSDYDKEYPSLVKKIIVSTAARSCLMQPTEKNIKTLEEAIESNPGYDSGFASKTGSLVKNVKDTVKKILAPEKPEKKGPGL